MTRSSYTIQDEAVVDASPVALNFQNYDNVNANMMELNGNEAIYALVAVNRSIVFTSFIGGQARTRTHALTTAIPIKRFGPFDPSWGRQTPTTDETLDRKLFIDVTAGAATDVKLAIVRENRPTRGV